MEHNEMKGRLLARRAAEGLPADAGFRKRYRIRCVESFQKAARKGVTVGPIVGAGPPSAEAKAAEDEAFVSELVEALTDTEALAGSIAKAVREECERLLGKPEKETDQ